MKSTVIDLDDNKVKVTVEVDEVEFDRVLDDTFRKIAQEVTVPGFRRGKVPRRILEARIGAEAARSEALRDAIPEYYGAALREHLVDAIAPPDIDITGGESDGPVVFDAVVEVRPRITIADYGALEVTVERPEASDEEVEAQIDRIREQYSDLVDVDRPAVDGDHVLMDITGSQDGEEIAGLTAQDYSYEVGLEALVSELDENLRGGKPGDILTFDAAHPQDAEATLSFRVLVKGVREKVLPDLDDEWVAENTEAETVEGLRAEHAERLTGMRVARLRQSLRDKVAEALAELVDTEPPPSLVESVMEDQLQNLVMTLQAQGMDLQQWMQITGQSPDQLRDGLREGAETTARVDLALRAVAEAEGLAATDEEVDEEITHTAGHVEMTPEQVRERLTEADGLMGMRAEITKRKAMDWLVERARLVDDEGAEIDRSVLDEPDDDAPDTDETGSGAETASVGASADDTTEEA